MSLAVYAFAAVSVAELVLWAPLFWKYRVWLASLAAFGVFATTAWLLISEPSFLSALLASIAVYDVINLGRIMIGRMRERYLYKVTFVSAVWLTCIQALILLAWWLMHSFVLPFGSFWITVLLLQVVVAVSLLLVTLRHINTTRPPVLVAGTAPLPSLTVAIPARNETEQLQECLRLLIASDYPKLEVLVLDDCSQNRRTPEIIRDFAHDGVRFLGGTPSEQTWLAKNHAYQQLADAASGELILFCGVDARFEPQSLRLLVQTMLQKNKTMISVIPRNVLPKTNRTLAMFIQPMRYAWEIGLPRKLFRRPPVLSTCWIIRRPLLESAGSFKAVSRSIVPESYFARTAVVHDGYSFMQSSPEIGISCFKNVHEQHDTATRTKYPQLHRRPELVALLTLAELLTIILPIAFLAASFSAPELRWLGTLSSLTSLLLITWYTIVVWLTYRKFVIRSLWSLPIAVINDIAVLNYSMLKYEFSVVLWKDRNVCIPVMRVEPRLPNVPAKLSEAQIS